MEPLEGRRLPAQFGVPWHQADHLTVSFVPDGTSVAGTPSDLFRTLNSQQPMADWQREILGAFQTWAAVADINFALVPDDGQPLGTPGPDQGDSRFGDIRIAAQPMSPEVLAVSVPHDPFLSGTWSGDIILNDAAPSIGQTETLFPVLLHEVGHVLGFDDNNDPASVMYSHLDDRTALAPSDIAAVQALYAPRDGDDFEGPWGNNTLQTATPMPEPAGYDGTTPLLFYANLSSTADVDNYTLKVPDGYAGPLTIRLQTAGVSLLEPHLTVFDGGGLIVGDLGSTSLGGDILQVHLPDVQAGQTYTVEVRGATSNIFGLGEYVMAATFDARSTFGPAAIDRLARQSYSYLSPDDIEAIFLDPVNALFHVDAHTNDTSAAAEDVEPDGAYGSEAPDRITASLSDRTDVDVYHIETPESERGDGPPLVMTVTVRATQVNGIMPTVAVFDEDLNAVPALVLAHGDGTFTIQVTAVQPDSDYFVRVSADPTSGKSVGNYDLDVEYGHTDAAPTSFLDASVFRPSDALSYRLVVAETQLFDLLLAATAPAAPGGAAVRMFLTDGQGRIVAERTATAGDTAGGDPVLLPPGIYQATFIIEAPGTASTIPLSFHLYGASLTDPIGPALESTTLRPLGSADGGRFALSLPVLASDGAPFYWLAVSLSGRGATSLAESAAPAPTSAGPIPAPAVAFATLGDPALGSPTTTVDGASGIDLASIVGGTRPLSATATHSPIIPLSISVPLIVSGIPILIDAAEPGAERPRNPERLTQDGASNSIFEALLRSRTPATPSSSDIRDATSSREAPVDQQSAPPDAQLAVDEPGVGRDLVHTVAFLGTVALLYTRLHSSRTRTGFGPFVRPFRARHPFPKPRSWQMLDVCRN